MNMKAILKCLVLGLAASSLFGMEPVQGRDFRRVANPSPRLASGKIEVIQFFYYQCKPCARLDPALMEWSRKLPPDVVFRRAYVAFYPSQGKHHQLFITLEGMGLLEKFQPLLFSEIDRVGLHTDSIGDWMVSKGVDRDTFLARFNSFTTAVARQRADQLWKRFEIDGVPSVVVDGRFYVGGPAGSDYAPWFGTLDAVIEMARRDR